MRAPDPLNDVPRPGDRLLEVLQERHMSQAELCDRMGRQRKVINEIIKGKAGLNAETAFQLELVLGIPASYWNKLESDYQVYEVRRRHEERLAQALDWLDELPVEAMVEARWIEPHDDPLSRADAFLRWFGVASPEEWYAVYREPQTSYRRSPFFPCDPGSLAAWMRAGEKQAQEMDTPTFNRGKFQRALQKVRGLVTRPVEELQDGMIEHSMAAGVAVAFARELPGLEVAGAARWLSPRKALIQLSLLHRTLSQLCFTFFHEAAHLLQHGKKNVFLDGRAVGKVPRDDILEEVEADHFAANLLIPAREVESLRDLHEAGDLDRGAILEFAQRLDLTPGIVIHHIGQLGWPVTVELRDLDSPLVWAPPGTYVDI